MEPPRPCRDQTRVRLNIHAETTDTVGRIKGADGGLLRILLLVSALAICLVGGCGDALGCADVRQKQKPEWVNANFNYK